MPHGSCFSPPVALPTTGRRHLIYLTPLTNWSRTSPLVLRGGFAVTSRMAAACISGARIDGPAATDPRGRACSRLRQPEGRERVPLLLLPSRRAPTRASRGWIRVG